MELVQELAPMLLTAWDLGVKYCTQYYGMDAFNLFLGLLGYVVVIMNRPSGFFIGATATLFGFAYQYLTASPFGMTGQLTYLFLNIYGFVRWCGGLSAMCAKLRSHASSACQKFQTA